MGQAKSRAARALADAGLARPGGVWATRMHMRRITDDAQFRETIAYIRDHSAGHRLATTTGDG